jgi:hypothetical protein
MLCRLLPDGAVPAPNKAMPRLSMCSAHESHLAMWEAFARSCCYIEDNNNKKIRERSGSQRWSWTMAPNLALLAFTPDLTGLSAAALGKSPRPHWFAISS